MVSRYDEYKATEKHPKRRALSGMSLLTEFCRRAEYIPSFPKNNNKSMQPLSQGIIHDGGHFSVSSRMGMTPVSKKKGPKMSFADVVRGIREFNEANGVVGRFPSQKELREGNRCDLLYWARQYGMSEVSEYMGLRRAKGGRPALRSERDDP